RILFCSKYVSGKADVGGDGTPELLRVNHFWPGQKGDANVTTCGARPVMHVEVPRGDTRRFKACQIGRVNQELSNATRARKSDGRRHQLRSTVYGNLPRWPKNGVVFKYLEMFQFTHTYRYATLAPGDSIGAEPGHRPGFFFACQV